MKHIMLSLLFTVPVMICLRAQSLTSTHTVPVATLEVGYYTTTALVFPAPIVNGDRGYKDLKAIQQSKVSNVLNLKAAVKNFVPTNLHVYTTDSKVYTFLVVYKDNPATTTYDIASFPYADKVRANPLLGDGSGLLSEPGLQKLITTIHNADPFLHKSANNDDAKVKLLTIHQVGDNLFFKFKLTNSSNLLYHLDFVRAYITDMQRGKRSSLQQRELIAAYQDSVMPFARNASVEFVIAVPKFTLTEGKRFHFEFFERNGGRNIKLDVKNRQLYKARRLQGHS